MTTTVEGIGPQLERARLGTDPRGVLVFEYLPDDLQRLEDQRAFADYDVHRPRGFERPAVDCERTLLAHLGYQLPDEFVTSFGTEPAVCATADGRNSKHRRRYSNHDHRT